MLSLENALITAASMACLSNAVNIDELSALKKRIMTTYPLALSALKLMDASVKPHKAKGYSLLKVINKKHGFYYYVRYVVNGKVVSSKWSTKTNNYDVAVDFAINNRDRLLDEYELRKKYKDIYEILSIFYAEGSKMLHDYERRHGKITDNQRKSYIRSINNYFIPFLKDKNIKRFSQIKPSTFYNYQGYLMKKGLQNESINVIVSPLKNIFSHLCQSGIIPINPARDIKALAGTGKRTGCYEIDKLKDVFQTDWEDKKSYLLNMK